MKCLLYLLAACLLLTRGLRAAEYQPQEGDLVFQSLPHNEVIDAIEGCTGSPFSHCGIVVKNKRGWWVLEAIGPVQEGALTRWIAQGREQKFAVYRLKAKHQPQVPAMIEKARQFLGRPYDIQYQLDDAKIYCSELIYKAWLAATGQNMGKLVTLGELNWKPHETVIRAITNGLPLERVMITPRDLAGAAQLDAVLPMGKHDIVYSKEKKLLK